jgi:hypothetical protein
MATVSTATVGKENAVRKSLMMVALAAAAGVTGRIAWDELPALRRYLKVRQM